MSDFLRGRAEFRRQTAGWTPYGDRVSPEDDIELRRVSITNRSWTRKTLDVTSYSKSFSIRMPADALHPAFSNLFVQTEMSGAASNLCTRRPRSRDERTPWMFT